jgi:hypothetical protein
MTFYSPASYDRSVKIVTFSLWIVLPVIDGIILFAIFSSMRMPPGIMLTTGILLLSVTVVILGVTYLFSPKSYVLASNGLIIQRPIRQIFIRYEDITDVIKKLIGRGRWRGSVEAGDYMVILVCFISLE